MTTPGKIIVGVLTGIGALAIVAAAAMTFMHFSMMGRFGC